MTEKWRKSLDEGYAFGALLTDLSKAFDSLPHELLIAKIYAYGLDIPSLKLLYSYMKTKSEWNGTYCGKVAERLQKG